METLMIRPNRRRSAWTWSNAASKSTSTVDFEPNRWDKSGWIRFSVGMFCHSVTCELRLRARRGVPVDSSRARSHRPSDRRRTRNTCQHTCASGSRTDTCRCPFWRGENNLTDRWDRPSREPTRCWWCSDRWPMCRPEVSPESLDIVYSRDRVQLFFKISILIKK